MRVKRRKLRLDGYYVIGPGPLALKNVQGVYTQSMVPIGQFAIVYDDEGEPRLQSESMFVSYESASVMADFLNESLD